MLIIGIVLLVLSRIIINKKEIFFRLSLGIILYSLILSSQSWIIEGDLGILGGLFHINNLINGIEIYIYLISLLLLSLILKNHHKFISSEYYIMILFSLLGMVLLICSYDLISTFLSIEFQSLSLYIITTITKREAIAAGLKYYLLGSLSSAILLLGLVLIYIVTGVTQYDSLFLLLYLNCKIDTFYFIIIIIMIMVGLLFKIGAAPFHNWAPDVYDGVPTIITSWIAIMGKISILIFICITQSILFNNNWNDNNIILNLFEIILAISTFLSLIIGSTLGLVQHKIKRLLAYSSISHLGFILLALIAYQQSWVITGLISFLFYMFQYWISLICTFAILIFLGRVYDLQYIKFLKGLFYLNPLITLSLIINLFSLAGIPPLIGFFGKQMVLYTSLLNGYYLLSIVAILTSVISAVYYLKIVQTTIFDNSIIENNKTIINVFNLKDDNLSLISWIISLITLITLLYFINPVIILDFIHLLVLSID